jgi:hypothetical protein
MEAARLAHGSPDYLRLARRAKLLSWASLAYMAAEGVVAVVAGIVAGSIALIGFGIDSAIEGFASVIIVWRFTGSRTLSEAAERKAQKLVAIQFFIVAPYVTVEAIRALANGTSAVGLALRQRRARGSRSCSVPTSPGRCSSDCSATHCSVRGGLILSWPY